MEIQISVWRGGTKDKSFPIREGNNLIGLGDYPEIDLTEFDVDEKVSEYHAIINRKGNSLTIEDFESLNGTFVNRGARLQAGVEYPIKPGDEIVIGRIFLNIEADDDYVYQ
jgi:pSer/pThr/pTyr-binding forkhead associated (FHA) protein